jgi:hypothetical protein
MLQIVPVTYERSVFLGMVVVALGALPACSGDDGGEGPGPGSGGSSNSVGCEGRGEQFSAGMTKEFGDGAIQVVLVKSDVAPPRQTLNTWTLEVKDGTGQAITGASVTASFMMPDHTHPARVDVGREIEPGVYEVVPYFNMAGYWETTVSVTPAGGGGGSVLFAFCISPD